MERRGDIPGSGPGFSIGPVGEGIGFEVEVSKVEGHGPLRVRENVSCDSILSEAHDFAVDNTTIGTLNMPTLLLNSGLNYNFI